MSEYEYPNAYDQAPLYRKVLAWVVFVLMCGLLFLALWLVVPDKQPEPVDWEHERIRIEAAVFCKYHPEQCGD